LQERLWGWTIEHQMQHQARLSGDFLSSWFEHDDSNDPNSYLRQQEDQDRKGKHAETKKEKENNNTPNSLAEWSRSIDTEKLTQKRQEIHRQKRVGKKPSKNNNNNYKNKTKHIAATKEYLTKLSNAMKTSPSSPYASNRDVRELYDASKKADQLGEPLLAIELLESLVKLTPNDARIYRRLSRMHNDQGNLDVARATLQDGLRKIPHNPWLWHGMGSLELSQGRTEYAIRCYERAIQEDPAFAHSYHAWGIHEFNNGQIAKAMQILKKGIEYCPTNHRLHHALGDLYRGAKLPKDAERSYRRALEEGPPVSHSFAFSALASVAYEQGSVDEARQWLYQSIETNNGRHAQGWLALAEIEEAEGNVEEARKVCEAAIIRYEKELVEARDRYKRDSNRMNHHPHGRKNYSNHNKHDRNQHQGQGERLDIDKPFMDPTKSEEIDRGLLKFIPKYRSGDKFLAVFRHWARLEGRYGTFDRCNKIYDRASIAFPLEYKIALDWARFHSNIKSHEARRYFVEACTRASTKDAEPYREYASFEMSLGEYDQARKILFRGAQAVARSPDGGTGKQNQQELARLYVTWAVCEWHLRNIPRVEVLFDHALRLTEVGSDEGSELRSFVLFCIAQLEYYEREELHLAQHCIGLCLKENSLPGGNAPIWNLWAKISRGLKNSRLEEKCVNETKRCHMRLEDLKEEDQEDRSSALDTMNMLKGSQNIQNMMRQEPWFDKLHAVRISLGGKEATMSSSSKFYSSINIPNFENHELQSETIEEEQAERQPEEASVISSEGQMS
jgi:tetratricopeptide (TPR) repeat protein